MRLASVRGSGDAEEEEEEEEDEDGVLVCESWRLASVRGFGDKEVEKEEGSNGGGRRLLTSATELKRGGWTSGQYPVL